MTRFARSSLVAPAEGDGGFHAYRARAKDQGVEFELDVFHVVTICDRKAILIETYGDEAAARRAAGLSR